MLSKTSDKGRGWIPTNSLSYLLFANPLLDLIAQEPPALNNDSIQKSFVMHLYCYGIQSSYDESSHNNSSSWEPISNTGNDLNSQCSVSSLDNGHRVLPLILLAPVRVSALQTSPQISDSRRSQLPPWLAKEKLGFLLVGLAFKFGPTSFRRPKPIRCEPTPILNKPRSAIPFSWSSLKQELCRSLNPNGRGHHRLEKALPLFELYYQRLQTLVTSSSMVVIYESKSLKNSGILTLNLNCRRLEGGLGGSIPNYHSPTISYIDQKHCLNFIAHKILKSHDTLGLNSNCLRFAYALGRSLANSQSSTILYINFNHQPFANTSKTWILFWYVLLLHVSNLRQALCGMLNLHDIHVREDPPVSLRFYIYLLPSPGVSFTCSHHLDPMLQRLLCEFSKRSTPYALALKQSSIDYITIVFRIFVVVLLWVVHLAPARIKASIPSSTSQSLLTVTNLSSFESFEDDLSINLDLTCANALPSFWLTALLVSKSMNIYLFMALGNAFYCNALNFGSLKSFSLYLFLFE